MNRQLLLAMALLMLAGSLCAQSRVGFADLKNVPPTMECSAMLHAEVALPSDVKLHLTGAEMEGESGAPYCQITGYVEPEVRLEVRLPVKNWTQRYLQTGCGGLCGNLNIHVSNDSNCAVSQDGEFALASTDMGHSGGMDAAWAADHPQQVIDFAYRGVHVTAVAAKAIIATFYGRQPRYSYFAGCSDGGREALMEAERFPGDFDGITAGAPAMNFITQNTFYHAWNALQNHDESGEPVLTADKLRVLHAAVMKACDALDGLQDGLISNPTLCHFDPATLVCKPGQDEKTFLTAAQAHVAAEIYSGAHDSQGQKLVISGPQYGSELAWQGVFIPRDAGGRTMSGGISVGTLRYLTSWTPHPNLTLADLHFDEATFKSFAAMHALFDATDPDLSAFAGQNHKLILWHGWADPHISPLNTVAYYTAMQRVMGEKSVQGFARLYLFPGGYHCGGGEGPFDVDLLSPIMRWVESGTAPEKLIASHRVGGQEMDGPPGAHAPMPVDRSRPIFPYPQIAVYKGSGSINEESSFAAAAGQPISPAYLKWLGSSFYQPGFETWCSVSDGVAHCDQGK